MTDVVFVGPSLPKADVETMSDAVILPPAAVGDVYRAARNRPRSIGIIDGYFEGVPSVWHKEILWALREGIPVYGGSSMGALRAAELHPFGMRGVGRIFEWFRDGTLEDDDEVAVLHGPAETGYLALSEPMVNFRATLERAAETAIVSTETHDALLGLAKSLFYQERAWDAVLDHPDADRLPAGERDALRDWLPQGRVDVKRADAISVLTALNDAGTERTAAPDFHLEWTTMWDKAVVFATGDAHGSGLDEDAGRKGILDEVRLDAEHLETVRDAALLALLAERDARRGGLDLTRGDLLAAMQGFRDSRGLFDRASLERWLAENDLGAEAFESLMAQQARLDWARSAFSQDLDDWLLAAARLSGAYPALAARAREKQRVLSADGEQGGSSDRISALHLRLWYFETRLGIAMPDDVEAFARARGFADRDAFDRALARAYRYERAAGGQSPEDADEAE